MSSGDEVNTRGMQSLVCTVYNVIIVKSRYFDLFPKNNYYWCTCYCEHCCTKGTIQVMFMS